MSSMPKAKPELRPLTFRGKCYEAAGAASPLTRKRVGSNVGYAMTKFAMVALTHGIRRQGRAAGIRATVICLGYVAADMPLNDDEIPRHEMSQPGDIARLAETALMLPNNASVSEMLVHCQFEPML